MKTSVICNSSQCFCTELAADLARLSITHFRRLADDTPRIVPHQPIEGLSASGYTLEQIKTIVERSKPNNEQRIANRLAAVREISERLEKVSVK